MEIENTQSKLTLDEREWRSFLLLDFFTFKKGNQNNMASLNSGNIPLVSAKKIDNGYKAFVSSNGKELYQANILTINNDGDGGAGLSYYQPYMMALDSHVTALVPRRPMNRHLLTFLSRCISIQHERFGNGYPLNEKRINKFRFMLPVCSDDVSTPDWEFMEEYMKQTEQDILKPTIDKLCKRLIINNLGGVIVFLMQIGSHSTLLKYSQKYNEEKGLKRQTILKETHHTFLQPLSTMVLMAA